MKEQLLLDTTYIPTYDEYVEWCEYNEITPEEEDSDDYWDFVSRTQEIEAHDFFLNVEDSILNSLCYWLITGSLGLWYGVRDIDMTYEKTLADAIKRCMCSCDDAIIKKRGSVIYVSGLHHDGRNHFEIRALSDIGLDRLERNGEISIKNRQNFVTLPKYLY